ncbi:MAG: class F sortase [Egibacteraceae bacterium]
MGRHPLVIMAGVFVLSAIGTASVTVATANETEIPPPLAVVSVPAPAPQEPAPQEPAPRERTPPELALARFEPVTIDVPSIGVRSVLQQVGLTAEHTMEVPTGPDYNDAAWYEHSSTPGSPGPAVIVGHVDSAIAGPSVFFDLGNLRPGDAVMVTRADGVVAVFRVDEVARYPKEDFPTELVYGDTDRALLRLITCGGVFDRATGHYRDNLVVFATLVDAR